MIQNYILWIHHPLHFHVLFPGLLHNNQFHLMNHQSHESSHWYHLFSLPYVKNMEVFFRTSVFYIIYSILFFPFTRVDWFLNRFFSNNRSVWSFFLLFLHGIRRISGVVPAKSSHYPDKSERSVLSFIISISVSFSIMVILLDKLFLWVYLDLSIESSVSGLFFWEVGTFFLCLLFLFFYCVNLLSCWNRGSDGFLHHIRFLFPFFFQPCQ